MLPAGRAGSARARSPRSLVIKLSSFLAAATVATVSVRYARAQTSDGPPAAETTRTAAALYDEAVRLFDAARYAESARAFLRADEAQPNAAALESALAAARRAGDPLLLAAAARRVLGREQQDAALTKQAAEALTEAERHVARVELVCSPAPCELAIDSEPVAPGLHHLLSGTHRFSARAPGGAEVEERASLEAGSIRRFELVIQPAAVAAPPVSVTEPPRPAPPRSAPEASPRKPLPPWALYTSAGVSGVLAIVSLWSGLDAMSAAEDYRAAPIRTQEALDSVEARATRTDVLWVTTALAAGFTTYAGFALVDWDRNQRSLRAAPLPGHAGLLLSGDLP
ncbi:MAG TPA: hypothetical protein VGK73_03220 [Polyangiaceae bacterium]